jgi:hypothetical protein
MEFRKKIKIENAGNEIGYHSELLSVGSCFSDNIGRKLAERKFSILQNPQGVIFNPVALANLFEPFTSDEIFIKNQQAYSWMNHSNIMEMDENLMMDRIQHVKENTTKYLSKASHVFVTFGSAWGYKHCELNRVIANCHKMPQSDFSKELSSVSEIVSTWTDIIAKHPNINWIFTVSPVRHWKDGVRENNVSKGVLHQSIHQLLELPNVNYFSAYELVMDELRDYRFFKKDMLHPNDLAVDYVWERFCDTYFSDKTQQVISEVEKLNRMISHKVMNVDSDESKLFLEELEKQHAKVELLVDAN